MASIRSIERFKIPEGIRVRGFDRFYGPIINRFVLRKATEIASYPEKLKALGNEKPEEIVVSVTSFPARIEQIYICLSQLFNQTLPPDRIELWLAESQFPDRKIPSNLNPLIELGLEVKFCPDDIKGHKKYLYCIKEHPESLIITFDDDLIYHEKSIEELYNSYRKYPKCVSCLRSQEITLDEQGRVNSYGKWKVLSDCSLPNIRFMPSTGAGTLYPPHILNPEVFNIEMLKTICLTADDLWMKTMSLLNGVKVARVEKYHRPLTTIDGTQDVTLADENLFCGKNDVCLRNLMSQYPDAFAKL